MAAGVELKVPHGGVFVLPIPNAVTHLGIYCWHSCRRGRHRGRAARAQEAVTAPTL